MKKNKHIKLVSLVLLATIGLNMFPNVALSTTKEENLKEKSWKDFAVVSLGDKDLKVTSNDITLIGDIHSNSSFKSGETKINGEGSINATGMIEANTVEAIIKNGKNQY